MLEIFWNLYWVLVLLKLASSPLCSAALSLWLYLLSWCGQSVCGIVKHVNELRKYGSPLIMLSDAGKPASAHFIVNSNLQEFSY